MAPIAAGEIFVADGTLFAARSRSELASADRWLPYATAATGSRRDRHWLPCATDARHAHTQTQSQRASEKLTAPP